MTEPAAQQPINVSAVITGKPGTGDQILPLLQQLAEGTHGEDGCLLYSLQRGIENPDQFVTVEKWTSGDALTAHLATEHVQAALAGAGDLLAEPPLIIPTLPVAAGDAGKSAY
jgi:quinol monooxygenase YgiN